MLMHNDDGTDGTAPIVASNDDAMFGSMGLPTVLAEVAERLIAAGEDGFEDAVAAGLHNLGQVLQVDWAALRWAPGRQEIDAKVYAWSLTPETPVADPAMLPRDGSVAAFPLPSGKGQSETGVLAFGAPPADQGWAPSVFSQLRIASAIFAQALTNRDIFQTLAPSTASRNGADTGTESTPPAAPAAPVLTWPRQSQGDCRREDVQGQLGNGPIIGQSPAIRQVLSQLSQVAATDSTVLLLGETGTGKELLATAVHEQSARRSRTMVRVNCAAIPSTLIESELFGREKGAFTGAVTRQAGRFEIADRSTIFLDEIGDLPSEVQVKLLRVLEERQIERLGSPRSLPLDVRIIAATHRDLEKRIGDGGFREDLFYRLNVFPISVPALRERADDIPLLVWRFVIEFSKTFGKRIDAIARDSMAMLQGYHWPGNIRELRNVVERAMIAASGPRLTISLPAASPVTGTVRVKLEEVEREHIRSILERVRWRVRGAGGAAEQLGLRPTTLETRMAKLGLVRQKSA